MARLETRSLPFAFKAANEVIYVGREYNRECMLERNRYLVDHASILLAVYNGQYRSGTAMAIRYAKSKGREIIGIDPSRGKFSHQFLNRQNRERLEDDSR